MNLKKFLMAGGLSMVLILGACGSGEEEGIEEPATEEDSSASAVMSMLKVSLVITVLHVMVKTSQAVWVQRLRV